ncbi:MAG TPA: hypothetical protein VK461_14800 [Acidimicrobiales bacterium]|nr:hypothetical protein [Acidimicrobiales bacterium]
MVVADLGDGQFLWTALWWFVILITVWMVAVAFVYWRSERRKSKGLA